MRVSELRIRGFRNLSQVELKPVAGLNWIVGPNGQGKTNILEALYVTLKGQSFRPYSQRKDWLARSAGAPTTGSSGVHVHVREERGFENICEMRLTERGSWSFFLNEKRAPSAQLRTLVPIVVFSPDDHALVRKEPETRRAFLDDMLTDVCPGYVESLLRYNLALKSRNKLLRDEEAWKRASYRQEIETWTQALTLAGLDLLTLRREMWPAFSRHFDEIVRGLFTDYRPEVRYGQDFEGELNQIKLYSYIMDSWETDRATGWTHRGPHRDDLLLSIGGLESRAHASQGQSRMIALALKWSHAEWVQAVRNEIPIFLVDDFSSEFDAQRRSRLLSFLGDKKGQVFVTGTELSMVDSRAFSDYNLYTVLKGFLTDNPAV
ncbi:MAG: DNA replication and repair protein RecF [Bdellovibrionales bacterium]|nr:DNA replication and repair protein RecF [Bdellovibrionales bacterium]